MSACVTICTVTVVYLYLDLRFRQLSHLDIRDRFNYQLILLGGRTTETGYSNKLAGLVMQRTELVFPCPLRKRIGSDIQPAGQFALNFVLRTTYTPAFAPDLLIGDSCVLIESLEILILEQFFRGLFTLGIAFGCRLSKRKGGKKHHHCQNFVDGHAH